MRLLPFREATSGGLRLLSADSYGHLRRATSVARNFPRVPVFDPYLNHPDGAVWIWPPAFDLLIGGISRALFGPLVKQEQVAWVAASLPPILGALHIFPLLSLASRVLSRRRAFLSACAYAVLPCAAVWSEFGHADHHVAEVLILLLAMDTAVRATAKDRRPLRIALAGLALAATLLTWQGAVFVVALMLPWAVLVIGEGGVLLGAVATVMTALATAWMLGGDVAPFSFVSFGWFQPAFVASLTLAASLWALFNLRRSSNRKLLIAIGILATILAIAIVPNLGRIASAALRGGSHLGTRNTVEGQDDFVEGGYLSYPAEMLRLISECRPLLDGPKFPALRRAVETLSPGFLLLPLALLLWIRRGLPRLGEWKRPRGMREAGHLLFAIFGCAILLMSLAQRRNAYYLAIFVCLALGDGLGRLARPLPRRFRPLLFFACLCAVLLPGWRSLAAMAAYAEAPGRDFLSLLERIEKNDPPGVDPATRPAPKPGDVDGVMNPWSAGHMVTALVRRPSAADPFAYGWRRHCRLLTTPDEREAESILRGARCRYLVTANLRHVLPSYARAVGNGGLEPERMFAVRVHESTVRSPFAFLELALESDYGDRLPNGRILASYRVWKVTQATSSSASPAVAQPEAGVSSPGTP